MERNSSICYLLVQAHQHQYYLLIAYFHPQKNPLHRNVKKNVHFCKKMVADLHDGNHIAVRQDDVHDPAGKEDGEIGGKGC